MRNPIAVVALCVIVGCASSSGPSKPVGGIPNQYPPSIPQVTLIIPTNQYGVVLLQWNEVYPETSGTNNPATAYLVEKSIGDTNHFAQVATVPFTNTPFPVVTWTDPNTVQMTQNWYRVTAVNP